MERTGKEGEMGMKSREKEEKKGQGKGRGYVMAVRGMDAPGCGLKER